MGEDKDDRNRALQEIETESEHRTFCYERVRGVSKFAAAHQLWICGKRDWNTLSFSSIVTIVTRHHATQRRDQSKQKDTLL
jgi:hypothetical protein